MNKDCEVVRDLLPLYADNVCSPGSRELVESHVKGCPECRNIMAKLLDGRIEEKLHMEKVDVLEYGEKRFKRRTATVGSVTSGMFMIPILVCLIINILTGSGLSWFFIVLAALGVAASLIVVPLTVPEDKLFWTFCAFCVSLMVLLAVVCLVTGGNWFWIASSASLFGLSVIFLPFVVRAKPVQKLIRGVNKPLLILGVDAVLFVHMMNCITGRAGLIFKNVLLTAGVIAGAVMIALIILRKRGIRK